MLYLAEVHKKTSFRGSKIELKLLARQQFEQNWVAVPGDDFIVADTANDYNVGALVLVELTANRQIQNIQEAARQLVGILQNFSRLKDKFRTQEEEIESWKQSLIYQSQELTRREQEIELRQEELENIDEAELKLEKQRQEFEANKNQLQQELERDRQNLESAWASLLTEREHLNQHRANQVGVLNQTQRQQLYHLIDRLTAELLPGDWYQDQSATTSNSIAQQQTVLDQYWQNLEQQRQTAQQQQSEIDQQVHHLAQSWQAWQQAQQALEQTQSECRQQEENLQLTMGSAHTLRLYLQAHEELYQHFNQLVASGEPVAPSGECKIDIPALTAMPLTELQALVEALQHDLGKMASFVNDQEEELAAQHQAIEAIKIKIQRASDYDRLSLEGDLEFEQQNYKLLDETLQGQRQSLQERQAIFEQHRDLLERRQKQNDAAVIDLEPVRQRLQAQWQKYAEELQQLEDQIDQSQSAIAQMRDMIQQQIAHQESQRQSLNQQEQNLLEQRLGMSEHWGRLNSCQEILQPLQDSLNQLRHNSTLLVDGFTRAQQIGEQQKQYAEQLNQLIAVIEQAPEVVV